MAANDTNNNASASTVDAPKAGTSGIEELMSPVMQMLMSSEYTKTLADALRSAVKGGMMDVQEDETYQTHQFDIMASAGRQWYLDAREEERMTSAAIAEEERSRKEAENIANMDEIQKRQLVEEMLRSEKKDPIEELRDTFILKFDDFSKDRTVRNAINTDLDERTFWEKHNPFAGISKWNDNRKQKKIDKLDQKDQKEIKRGNNEMTKLQRELALLNEKKAKGKNVDPEKIIALAQKMQAASDKMKVAKDRIDNRHKSIEDTMAELDLSTLKNGSSGKANKPVQQDRMTFEQEGVRIFGDMAGGALGASIVGGLGTAIAGPIGGVLGNLVGGAAGAMIGKDTADKASGADKTADGQSSIGNVISGIVKQSLGADSKLGVETKNSSADDALAQQDKDIERNLNTNIRPEFYRKGNEAFDAILSGNVHVDTDEDSGIGGIFDLLKGAGLAAGLAAVVASIGKVTEAIGAFKKLWNTRDEMKRHNDEIVDRGKKALQDRANEKGYNSDELTKIDEEMAEMEKKLNSHRQSWTYLWGTKNAHKKEAEMQEKVEKMRAKRSKIQLDNMAKRDGWPSGEEWKKFSLAHPEYKKDGRVIITKEEWDKKQSDETAKASGGDASMQAPAAGSTTNTNTPNATTPASNVTPENVETPEQKAAREQKATEDGVKKAYLSPEVQAAMKQNAVETGKAIEGQLGVGS